MEVNLNIILSLEEATLRKLAVSAWNQSYIMAAPDITKFAKEVENNIDKLFLPKTLADELADRITPIGVEILSWRRFHKKYLKFEPINLFCLSECLCWTNLGTIDYRETARQVIKLELLDAEKRFILACLYCLTGYIPCLWEELPEEKQKYFHKEVPLASKDTLLEFCFPYILETGLQNLKSTVSNLDEQQISFIKYRFEYSAISGNKAATTFFFRYLPHDVREDSLMKMAQEVANRRFQEYEGLIVGRDTDFPEEKLSDVFCYLVSLMKPEHQMEIFTEQPCVVLTCFLDWPWQDLFMDQVEVLWDYLEAMDYIFLLMVIVHNMEICRYSSRLFQAFFLRGSKQYVNELAEDESKTGTIIRGLFRVYALKCISLFFKNIDSVNRKKIIFSKAVFKIFYRYIVRGKNKIVELCIRVSNLSQKEKQELKETYLGFRQAMKKVDEGHQHVNLTEREKRWQQFLDFLDENQCRIRSPKKSAEKNFLYHN